MSPSTGVTETISTVPERASVVIRPNPTPTRALRIGSPAATSVPSITSRVMPAMTSPAISPGPTTSGSPWVRLLEKSTSTPARSAFWRSATTASFTSGGTSIWPPWNATMPMAALLSAATVRMPRERSSRDAPSSSFVPWPWASAFFWSSACCWASSWVSPSTTCCGTGAPICCACALAASSCWRAWSSCACPACSWAVPAASCVRPVSHLLLLGRQLAGGLEGVGHRADAGHRAGALQCGADRRPLLVGERRAVGGVEHHGAAAAARRREGVPQLVGDLGGRGARDGDGGRQRAVADRIRDSGEGQQGDPENDDETRATGAEAAETVENGSHEWCFRRSGDEVVNGQRSAP